MSSRALCIGLTGGIGSGKSTVAEMFAKCGAAVIDTDLIAHQLTCSGGAAMPALIAAFGPGIADGKGALDRAAMRARVFADSSEREKLEAILHPLIRQESARQLVSVAAPYALLVVPLLAENLAGYRELVNRIAVVICDESQQLARTAERAGLDIEQAKAIIAAQATQAARIQIADDLIDNRGDFHSLEQQVERLHLMYLNQKDAVEGAT